MWTRRRFLQNTSLSLAALSSLQAQAAWSAVGPLGRPIGIQIYTVREAAAKDLAGTLERLAQIGYREIELAGQLPQPLAQARALLADNGLAVPSMHSSMSELRKSAQQSIDYAKAIGAQYLVCSFPATADGRTLPNDAFAAGMTLDDWKWNAEQLNRIGELARRAGVSCGYHNHNMEFRSYDGVVAFDELIRRTDPSLVTIELDVAWVATAGQDPIAYLRKYPNRISMLHVKDVRKDLRITTELQSQTTEVGSGKVDWKALFAATNREQIRHYFVEQENFERSPLEAVKISFDYLSTLAKSAA